ncbi:MAG: minor capsid protein, partial [Kiritimatiellales bacterium]
LHVFEGQADPIVRQAMEVALHTNVGLIKDIAIEHCGTLQNYVQTTIKANPFDLHAQQKGMQEYLEGAGFDKAKNRARLITRDQNNKLVGSMNEARHKSVGGEEYRWSTSRDARVRSKHAMLDGKIFRWDSPPSEGHPGQAIQCRCTAKLIFREPAEKSKPTAQIAKELPKPKPKFPVNVPVPNQVDITKPLINQRVANLSKAKEGAVQVQYVAPDKLERHAIREYQNGVYNSDVGGYFTIQRFLREGEISKWMQESGVTKPRVAKLVEAIDTGIAKSKLASDATVYRGVHDANSIFKGKQLSEVRVGDTFVDKGFLSTTTDLKTVERFTNSTNYGDAPALFNFELKKGQSGFLMNVVDGDVLEKELLLPRNSEYRVTAIKGNKLTVELVKEAPIKDAAPLQADFDTAAPSRPVHYKKGKKQ